MLQNIKNMSYGAARYTVLKELDTRGPIGRLLLNYDHQLASKMMNICDWIDSAAIALSNNQLQDMRWTSIDQAPNSFIFIAEKFPFLILTASELNWDVFISAWLVITHEFLGVMNACVEHLPREDAERLIEICHRIESTLEPTYTLAELGASYTDLIKASNEMVKELRNWRQSQPASLRLSQAYLRALGVIPDDEPGPCSTQDRNNEHRKDNAPPPPPPAPDFHENCPE